MGSAPSGQWIDILTPELRADSGLRFHQRNPKQGPLTCTPATCMEMDAGGDEHVSELQCDHVEGDDQDGVPQIQGDGVGCIGGVR